MFPQFDATCDDQPSGPGINDCPVGHVGGHGSQQWYHLAGMSTFQFCTDDGSMPECTTAGGAPKNFTQGAYVNGNNRAICDTGNGATSCLAGKFIVISYEGQRGGRSRPERRLLNRERAAHPLSHAIARFSGGVPRPRSSARDRGRAAFRR